MAKTNKDTHY